MNQHDALLIALNALQSIDEDRPYPIAKHAIKQINKALAQPEQEPIGWFAKGWQGVYVELMPEAEDAIPFYTAPVSKPWVSLTDDEIHEAAIKCVKSGQSVNAAIRAIEDKLKEKNNG